MIKNSDHIHLLQAPLELPCGAILKNRLAKSPMSDSLGDGEGNPTETQIRLYEKWAKGGVGLSLIGEVQGDPRYPEKPGNLIIGADSDKNMLRLLAKRATIGGANLWPQIGHAGALTHDVINQPKGPSALDLKDLQCVGMSVEEINELPHIYAKTARLAKSVGFNGVQIHAGHGFLLSQFLSPLFNHRNDAYGGSIQNRCRIILDIINEVRHVVGTLFPIGIRINSSDLLEGGLTETDALKAIKLLDQTSVDLIDISGGTYFPGAKASSEVSSEGPYFLDFARATKALTKKPLILTGGFKSRNQAVKALASGFVDMVGLARIMVLDPQLGKTWFSKEGGDPVFPKFEVTPPGGVTAWYTMRLTALAEDQENSFELDLPSAIRIYEERDEKRSTKWREKFF